MDIVDQLRSFVATAQTGSFTAAADQLGLSNRLTSKYVAELEARLGVRLLQRTTRRVGMTPAGEELLGRAPALLDDLDALLGEISEGSKGFTGVIRVSAPVTFGEAYVVSMLSRFAQANPGLSFDLRLNDSYVDLARDGVDIAFRIGETDTLSLKARKLGIVRSVLVASPDYLTAHGAPRTPEDLVGHTCIVDTNRRSPRRWEMRREDRVVREVQVNGSFHVNSARAASALAIEGRGIANVPAFALDDALKTGALVEVLPEYQPPPIPISAAYLEGRVLPRKVRALIDFAAKDLRASDML